jgi:hypothetical protein
MSSPRECVDALLETVMRVSFLLRRRYTPYRKWLFRAFRSLPDPPPGLVAAVEQLATKIDLATVEAELATPLDLVGTMANDSGLIAPQPLRKARPFLWTDFNCYGFAAAFDALLPEPLRGRLTTGPVDLWVSNHAALSPAVARAALL